MARRKRHTAEQIVNNLRLATAEFGRGKPIGAICKQIDVTEVTYSRWRRNHTIFERPGHDSNMRPAD